MHSSGLQVDPARVETAHVDAARVETAHLDTVPLVAAGSIAVRADRSEAFLAGLPLPLTFAQRCMLLALIRNPGRVTAREDLYQQAFGRALPRGSRAVDVHVGRIRRALGARGEGIVSVERVGYRLDPLRF